MVDIGGKAVTTRLAVAQARVTLGAKAFQAVQDATVAKGDVLGTSRIAGILAAKRCAELIPLCHSLPLSHTSIEFQFEPASHTVIIEASCSTEYRTGVEMEAMTAASVAALTLYDMCKGIDKGIVIEAVRLLRKTGGKSGTWEAPKGAGAQAVAGAAIANEVDGAEPADGVAQVHSNERTKPTENADVGAAQQPVRLVFFARVAELVGVREAAVVGWAPLSGSELLARLEERYPALAPARRLNLAVNQEHVTAEHQIQAGDEVAVFEPVTGG